jgi:hypothetical protein
VVDVSALPVVDISAGLEAIAVVDAGVNNHEFQVELWRKHITAYLENLAHEINNFTTEHEFRIIKAPQNRHNYEMDVRRFVTWKVVKT